MGGAALRGKRWSEEFGCKRDGEGGVYGVWLGSGEAVQWTCARWRLATGGWNGPTGGGMGVCRVEGLEWMRGSVKLKLDTRRVAIGCWARLGVVFADGATWKKRRLGRWVFEVRRPGGDQGGRVFPCWPPLGRSNERRTRGAFCSERRPGLFDRDRRAVQLVASWQMCLTII